MSNMPDKIYIPGKWLHIPSNHFETEDSPGATEYIRKEALLEWAKEQIKDYLDSLPEEIGWDNALKALISKLQSL